jgi:hypothetical protein
MTKMVKRLRQYGFEMGSSDHIKKSLCQKIADDSTHWSVFIDYAKKRNLNRNREGIPHHAMAWHKGKLVPLTGWGIPISQMGQNKVLTPYEFILPFYKVPLKLRGYNRFVLLRTSEASMGIFLGFSGGFMNHSVP